MSSYGTHSSGSTVIQYNSPSRTTASQPSHCGKSARNAKHTIILLCIERSLYRSISTFPSRITLIQVTNYNESYWMVATVRSHSQRISRRVIMHHTVIIPKYHVDFPAPFRLSHSCVTSKGPSLHNTSILVVCGAEGPLVIDAPHP